MKQLIQFKNKEITIFESQLFKTTSIVIQTDDGIIVVDPTWLPNEVEEIRQHVNKIKENKQIYLLFTHSDWDHILGYGAFPDAIIIASKGFKAVKDKESILEQIRGFDDQYYIDRHYPILYPKVDIVVIEDGQVFNIGKTTLTFYKADGHTDDGIFTIVEPLGIWIAGDYLSDTEFPYIYSSSEKYEETLKKTDWILTKHDIRFLVPGHGHVTGNREEMNKRKEESLRYIKDIRSAVESERDSFYLIESYSYLRGMRAFHEGNINLIKKEQKEKNISNL
ncbi:MBL fold metallo-hydrolase [Psychrobacillus antarcticus]|uniref:MBL fold metallo-hydrolase n=1 Tax=Psychrobacillus antarcticus TaxID=2879115 RepID=UPI002407B09B|nr:MBL fold metallo-hydrolase [Psychrobacillus antarcticus]